MMGDKTKFEGKIILAAGSDLFFSAKIKEAGNQTGVPVEFARKSEDVLEKIGALKPVLLILDLDGTRLDAPAVISSVRACPALETLPILGFCSHVNGALRRKALELGCTKVMPRSEFSARLPEILAEA